MQQDVPLQIGGRMERRIALEQGRRADGRQSLGPQVDQGQGVGHGAQAAAGGDPEIVAAAAQILPARHQAHGHPDARVAGEERRQPAYQPRAGEGGRGRDAQLAVAERDLPCDALDAFDGGGELR